MTARCVAVAYSGGRDSTALLHATLAAAAENGVRVVALHVHHGLSAHADEWLAHCEAQCRRWAARGWPVGFAAQRLAERPARGDSIEAWARRARYAALRALALAHGAPLVLLAHHRQDQAETLLLQALRGGGVAGLAAMPQLVERDGLTWARPWLGVPSSAIAAYVRRHRLRHIEDDSNADPRYARNRLRHEFWPALLTAFPHAEAALAASAGWAQEAAACAADLAAIDLASASTAAGLDLAAWTQLSPHRRSNALRAWLKQQTGGATIPGTLVQRLLSELPGNAPAQWPLDGFRLRRFQGRLQCLPDAPPQRPAVSAQKAATLAIRRAGTYALAGWHGRLLARRVRTGGVAASYLTAVNLRERVGGEQFQAAPRRPARSLKKQFQARGVPAWHRDGPLLYAGEQLLYVPGLGIDARVLAGEGCAQFSLEWLPDPA